jgi:hypothetical protein
MECPEADRLFEHFVRATEHYVMAVNTLAVCIGIKERFEEAVLRVTETYAECKAALSALQVHCEQHNCGTSFLEIADPSDQHPS